MAISLLTNSLYGTGSLSTSTMQSLISQSTSMNSQIYSAVQSLNNTSTASTAAYMDIDQFLKTYQSDLNVLQASALELTEENSQSVFAQYEAGKATVDDIVSSVETFVQDYNSVTSLLSSNENRGSGTASHLASFSRGIASDEALEAIGISYDKNGNMQLDSDALKEALEKDYDTTKELLGGQHGMADRALMKAENALSDSVQRIVSNDLDSLVNSTQNYSSIQYTYDFSKAGVYNLSNAYVVGLFVNTTA